MKILITGGAGFIGSNFIHYWMRTHPQDELVNLDSLTYAGNLENLSEVSSLPNYTFVKGDIADPIAVREAMQGVDTVVHFAAESHVDRSLKDARPFIHSNILGTYELLQAAKELSIKRFHLVSTDEVYGQLGPNDPAFNEKSIYAPRNPYSVTKTTAEQLAKVFYETYGLPLTISNCGNNYGYYHFPEKLIPLMILNALEDKPLPIYGDGQQVRDWVFVEDHARAIELILEKGVVGESYLVPGHPDLTNLQVVKMILKHLGKGEELIQYVPDRPGHDRRYAIDGSKIEKELGYAPAFSFEEGLAKTIDWYKEHQEWCNRVRSQEYQSYYAKHYGN